MNHVVFYSGGVGSFCAAKRLLETVDKCDVELLFTDTLMEDEDLYRFVSETSEYLQVPVTKLTEGRDPWQVFFDVKFLGNSRIDPCSKKLKREIAQRYIREKYEPDEVILYLGIDWSEEHRLSRSQEYWKPYQVLAPMVTPPLLMKANMMAEVEKIGIKIPRLYEKGFAHNNCGGFCIKAGQGQFAQLLEHFPERFDYHAKKEQELRAYLGKDVSILRKQIDGVRQNYTLEQLRCDLQKNKQIDIFELGGCGCMLDDYDESEIEVSQ